MSGAPYLARGARTGFQYSSAALDHVLDQDALICTFNDISMGEALDRSVQASDLDRAS